MDDTKTGLQDKDDRLDWLRQQIDEADTRLLADLNARAALSLEVGKLKAETNAPVFRPSREAALLDKLAAASSGPLPADHLRAIYREILSSSRALQRTTRIAFLGPEGTFSNMAALEYFGHGNTFLPMPHLADVFEAVQKRECDLAAVPLENSLNGTVGQTLDLFSTHHEVHVQAEWFSRIRLSLMSPETSLEDIKVVYSHPQPLGQCAIWLREHLPGAHQVSLESTAAAGQRVAQESGSAAIGDAGLAARLGLNLLARDIEDISDNWTRFFVIGPDPIPSSESGANKSSIMFTVLDKPGSLAKVLETLSGAGINMSKLESRPLRGERWKYVFFADLDCDITAPHHSQAFEAMAVHCLSAHILGSYPAGRHIHAPH